MGAADAATVVFRSLSPPLLYALENDDDDDGRGDVAGGDGGAGNDGCWLSSKRERRVRTRAPGRAICSVFPSNDADAVPSLWVD